MTLITHFISAGVTVFYWDIIKCITNFTTEGIETIKGFVDKKKEELLKKEPEEALEEAEKVKK